VTDRPQRRLARRAFLRGAGGFALAIPFLPSLLGSRVAADASTSRRFVGVFSLNGQFEANWHPDMTGASRVASNTLSRSLTDIEGPISNVIGSQFDGLRDKITLLRGLDGLTETGHNRCFPLTASTHTEGGMERGSAPFFPYSVDAVLEHAPSFYTTPPVLGAMRLSPMLRRYDGELRAGESFSWWTEDGVTTRLPVQSDAEVVFRQVFAGSEPSDGPDPNARRQLVIDRVKDDFDRLRTNPRLGSQDRERLSNYADHLRDLQTRLSAAGSITCTGPDVTYVEDAEAMYTNHIDLLVAALACGITRVGTLFIKHVRADGEEAGFHSNSHLRGPDAERTSASHNAFIATRVAELLSKMDALVEPDGNTLLDNSLVLWGNELGDGGSHGQLDMPMLLAGSACGHIRTGVALDYRSEEGVTWTTGGTRLGRPYSMLLTTAMAAMGLSHHEWELGDGPGFGDHQKLGHRYAKGGGWDRYADAHREMLPHLWMG